MKTSLTILLACLVAAVGNAADPFAPPNSQLPKFKAVKFNVRDFGATGNGLTNDTPAINKAIERCNASGGGDVIFPAGIYSAASIHLKSNVRFVLDSDAVITGAASGYDAPEPNEFDKYQDYGHSHFRNSLMWGENIVNFAIVGGKVNGGHIIRGGPSGRPHRQGTRAGRKDGPARSGDALRASRWRGGWGGARARAAPDGAR